MRRAQLRLRQLATIVAVALFVTAALTGLPRPRATELVARAAAQQGPIQRLPPSGRRWY